MCQCFVSKMQASFFFFFFNAGILLTFTWISKVSLGISSIKCLIATKLLPSQKRKMLGRDLFILDCFFSPCECKHIICDFRQKILVHYSTVFFSVCGKTYLILNILIIFKYTVLCTSHICAAITTIHLLSFLSFSVEIVPIKH